jgi:glycosyl transferase family 25
MRIYLINLARRPDRLAAMTARTEGLALARIEAVDAAKAEPELLDPWFARSGPLGEIPPGDKACLLSHRLAWQSFLDSGEAHAVFLEDDVMLSRAAGALLKDARWIPAGATVIKLEHYGPKGQRVLLKDLSTVKDGFQLGRILSRHTGAAAYILSREAAALLLAQKGFDLPVDHLLFNPNNSGLFAQLSPLQLLPAIARQEQFLGARAGAEKSDIEGTRKPLRALSATYIKRELVRFAYDLKLLPRQAAALLTGARFVPVTTAP